MLFVIEGSPVVGFDWNTALLLACTTDVLLKFLLGAP